jgi:hypothetical protein
LVIGNWRFTLSAGEGFGAGWQVRAESARMENQGLRDESRLSLG